MAVLKALEESIWPATDAADASHAANPVSRSGRITRPERASELDEGEGQ